MMHNLINLGLDLIDEYFKLNSSIQQTRSQQMSASSSILGATVLQTEVSREDKIKKGA